MTGFSVFTSRFRKATGIFVAVLLSLSWVPAAVAQNGLVDETTYEMAGNTITWSAPWEYLEEFVDDEIDVQNVTLTSQSALVDIYSLPSGLDINQVRDLVVDEIWEVDGSVTIDRGSYDDISYSLDIYLVDDSEYGVFSTVRAGTSTTRTFVVMFIAPIPVFASQFSSAQSSVQVDGTGIFQGVGGQGLQDLLEANAGTVTEDPSSDDSGADDTDSADDGGDAADDDSDGGPKFGGSNRSDDEETPESDEPAGDDGDDTSTGDGESFAGSAFGVEFTWDSAWTINENLDTPVIDGEDGLDSVALTRTNDEIGLLTLSVTAEVEPGVDGLVAYWQSDDFVAQAIASPDGGVLLGDSDGDAGAVVFIDYLENGTQIVTYREAWYLESEQAYVTIVLTTIPAHLESSLEAATEGVTVDGEPVLTYFSYDDIIDAAGEDPENTI